MYYSATDVPTRYLDPDRRNCISTFSALANAVDQITVLEKLKEDLASGAWEQVR